VLNNSMDCVYAGKAKFDTELGRGGGRVNQ